VWRRSAGPIAFTTALLRGIGRVASTVQRLHVGAATPRALCRPHVGGPSVIALQALVMDACRGWPDQGGAVAPIRAVVGPIDLMGADRQPVHEAHGLDSQAAAGIGDCHIVRPTRESKGGKRGSRVMPCVRKVCWRPRARGNRHACRGGIEASGGPGGNRTHIRGFAVRCITTLPPDLKRALGLENRENAPVCGPREPIAEL
jgi:hypothetical protein